MYEISSDYSLLNLLSPISNTCIRKRGLFGALSGEYATQSRARCQKVRSDPLYLLTACLQGSLSTPMPSAEGNGECHCPCTRNSCQPRCESLTLNVLNME